MACSLLVRLLRKPFASTVSKTEVGQGFRFAEETLDTLCCTGWILTFLAGIMALAAYFTPHRVRNYPGALSWQTHSVKLQSGYPADDEPYANRQRYAQENRELAYGQQQYGQQPHGQPVHGQQPTGRGAQPV